VLLVLLGGIASSHAQMGGGHGSRHKDPEPTPQPTPQRSAAPTKSTAVPEPWPRLDVGAILCKSRDDLVKYQTKIAGGAAPGPAPDCRTIGKQIGIKILDQDGPSRTQVVATDETKLTGWTNTYLPSTPPASLATGAGK
jgi:hypothetical protein